MRLKCARLDAVRFYAPARGTAARAAFDDALSDDREDTRHGDTEERFPLLGMVDNQFLFVSYTLRV